MGFPGMAIAFSHNYNSATDMSAIFGKVIGQPRLMEWPKVL